jgi:hypothetical protein
MPLNAVPIKPVEAHRLDDPRRPRSKTPEAAHPERDHLPERSVAQLTPPGRERPATRPQRHPQTHPAPRPAPETTKPTEQPTPPVNPYARAGRPHQVAFSLYAPQWQRIEQQCAELRAHGVPDATVTRWLFALLHFRAPREADAAAELLRRWARLEADEDGPYFGLRKEARGVRVFEILWERQRAIVTELRRDSGPHRPTLATWATAVVELEGPKSVAESRELLRELRIVLAGDPPDPGHQPPR